MGTAIAMASDDSGGGDQVGAGEISAAQLAALINVTARRVQQLAKEGVLPKASRGRYPMAACVRAYCKYLQESGGDADNRNPDRMDPFKRRAYYEAEHQRLVLETKAGDLVARIAAEREITRLFAIVDRFLEVFPDRLEREGLIPAHAANAVVGLIDRQRVELHAEIQPKAEPNGKRKRRPRKAR